MLMACSMMLGRVTTTSLSPVLPKQTQPSADCLHVTVSRAGSVTLCAGPGRPERFNIQMCVYKCGRRFCIVFRKSEGNSRIRAIFFVSLADQGVVNLVPAQCC